MRACRITSSSNKLLKNLHNKQNTLIEGYSITDKSLQHLRCDMYSCIVQLSMTAIASVQEQCVYSVYVVSNC